MQPAVFLDRDNTLIHNDGDLGDPNAVRLIDGVASGLRSLREAGFQLIVVTNQAGVGRGKFSEDDVDAVHQRIAMLVDEQAQSSGLIERFYYCPYHPEATVAEYRRDHPWRKPHPGMILQAAHDLGLDLANSWLVGDQERDIRAGQSAGCRTVLVSRNRELVQQISPTAAASEFRKAVEVILAHGPAVSAKATREHQRLGGANPAAATNAPVNEAAQLRRAVADLAEEIRCDRLRRAEFTMLRMAAGMCQLLALLLALLGLLQLSNADVFQKWMLGAALVQLFTMTLLIVDLKS